MRVLSVHSNILKFVILISILGLFFLMIGKVTAAEISISPSSGSYETGESVVVTVEANPEGENLNAVEVEFLFDPAQFRVVNVSKAESVITLWTTEPLFSNTTGTFEFGGGSPTSFPDNSTLLTVTLNVLQEGPGRISISKASVRDSDGEWNDVFAIEEESDPEVEISFSLSAPTLNSSVYKDEDEWYATTTGLFTWQVPVDVNVIALDVSTTSDYEPMTIYDPPIEEILLTPEELREGIQYLSLQYKSEGEWGEITHRKIQIDTTSPEPFTITANDSDKSFPRLSFNAVDSASGVQKYDVAIDGIKIAEMTSGEATNGYQISALQGGSHQITVTAYDKAGNTRDASVLLYVSGGKRSAHNGDGIRGIDVILMLIILIVLGQFLYIAYLSREHERKEEKLRQETREVEVQMEKIFSALRDEIYDQINMISKHKVLSKKEKQAVEGLNQALEVSETLIEKEISDVSKILKKKKK